MSDGGSNPGVATRDAAMIAKQWYVKVYTVGRRSRCWCQPTGVGSPVAAVAHDGDNWDPVDEKALKMIAQLTGGTYQRVSSSSELRTAYAALGHCIARERRATEVSGLGSLAAALVVCIVVASRLRMSP